MSAPPSPPAWTWLLTTGLLLGLGVGLAASSALQADADALIEPAMEREAALLSAGTEERRLIVSQRARSELARLVAHARVTQTFLEETRRPGVRSESVREADGRVRVWVEAEEGDVRAGWSATVDPAGGAWRVVSLRASE